MWPKDVLKTRPLPYGFTQVKGKVVVLAIDPAHAHVGPRRVQRHQHAQLRAVVGRPVLVDLIGDAEVLPAEGRHQRMPRLLHRDADLLGPRVPRERRAEQFLELRPVPVGGDGEMKAHDPAAVFEEIQEALAEDLFHRLRVGAELLQRLLAMSAAVG